MSATYETDSQLIQAIIKLKEGDESGFVYLYEATYKYVSARAKAMLDDEQERQDFIQEIYLAIYRSIKNLDEPEKIYGWIKTLIFNQYTKLMRKRRKEVLVSEEGEDLLEEIPDYESQTKDDYVNKEDIEIIRSCIERLSEEQRTVIMAYYFDNLKVGEISDLFSVSDGTVKSRLFVARKKLKENIEEEERKLGYKLHSFGGLTLILAIRAYLQQNMEAIHMEKDSLFTKIGNELGLTAQSTETVAEIAMENMISETAKENTVNVANVITRIAEIGGKKLIWSIVGVVSAAVVGISVIAMVLSDKLEEPESVIVTEMETTEKESTEQEITEQETTEAEPMEQETTENNSSEENKSFSNTATGNSVVSTGNNSEGNTGKVDDKYQNELEKVSKLAQEIVSKVTTPSMSEFEKAMAIHDWMICNVVYELDGYLSGSIPYECYTAYGALKNGVAVCDGYTKAFNLLAEKAGLESMRVTGEADGGSGRDGHAWNKVKIDGVWYNVDVTWDDAVTDFEEEKDTLFTNGYEYFLLSDEDWSKDHFPDYETVECLVTYDRISLYKYAFSKVDYGENIAFAVTAEEVVKAINTFGKANISDIEIWFYDPEDEGFSIVMDAAKDAKYPNTGNATGHGNTKGMMQCYLTIVTEEVLSEASIFTDKDDYVEIINSKFDTGVTSFYLIYDTCDGSSFTNGFETTFINYEFDFDWLPSYDGGKLYLYKFTLKEI